MQHEPLMLAKKACQKLQRKDAVCYAISLNEGLDEANRFEQQLQGEPSA